jgi:hypothetical protein
LATAPFCVVFCVVRRALLDVDRVDRDLPFPDEPFLLVDLFGLELRVDELLLDELLLEDRVVCAIVIAFLGFGAGCADRAGGAICVTRCREDLNFLFRVSAQHSDHGRSTKGQDAPAQDSVQQQ